MSVNTNDFSHTCHGVGGGRPAWAGVVLKDRRPLLKREYHSDVFDWLRQDSPKAACSISYVSAPVFPRRKQTSMHTRCCTFSSIVKCDAHCCTHSHKGLHRANGRDTNPQFCTYTCTELPRVLLCYHFAAYYSFPGKKISPGIKWSAHVFVHLLDNKVC